MGAIVGGTIGGVVGGVSGILGVVEEHRPSYRYQGEPPRDLLVPFDVLEPMLPCRSGICTMKKPSKTAAELEASIKVEMEDICDWPTDIMISVQPDGDSWKVAVVQEGSEDDADRRQMIEQIAERLKAEYDLKG